MQSHKLPTSNPRVSRFACPILSFLLILGFVGAPSLTALDDNSGEAIIATYPPAYIAAIRDAMRSFEARDFTRARLMVDRADGMFKVTPLALNIRGAICIEEKKYEEGRAFCEQALGEQSRFFPAQFNLCEIAFVQKNYAVARTEFEKLLGEYPKNDLVKFRIFLTYLLENNEEGVQKNLGQIPFLSDTPVYYYTRAAMGFAAGNTAEAREWLDRGYFVFPPARHQNFIDVFYDLGWVERPGFSLGTASRELETTAK